MSTVSDIIFAFYYYLFIIMLHYKTFRFCYRNVNLTVIARRHKALNVYGGANAKVLTEMFGFTESQVAALMHSQPALKSTEPPNVIESIQFCKSVGISNAGILKYPGLLTTHPLCKINHYDSLQDTGCEPIDEFLLSRARTYLGGKIKNFKQDKYLKEDINVANRLMNFLDPPIETPEELKVDLNLMDEMKWAQVHKIILVNWLKRRLNITDDDVIRLLRIHRMIKNKSFRTIDQNITFAESLGLTTQKILKCGYLLHNHLEYPKTMLRDHPFIAGIDLLKLYKTNPKMMMISPRRFNEIYAVLKEFNISDEAIRNKPDVFSCSPISLRARLDEIRWTPELRVLFDDPRMLKLVIHYSRAKTRLNFLKKLKLRCATVSSIGHIHNTNFQDYIEQGKDLNKTQTVVQFFARLLDKDKEDVRKKLRRHPFFNYVPFVDIDKTFRYLLRIGYSKENIYRCLLILLYPMRRIRNSVAHLREDESLRFTELSECKQLNLILYSIEKQFHFTGQGIWWTDPNVPKTEEHTLE